MVSYLADTQLKISSETENYCWMLHEIAKGLGTAKNLSAILNLITKSVIDTLNIKASSVRLLSDDNKKLELVAAYGLSDEYLNKGPVDLDKSLIDKEAMEGEPVIVEDIEKERMLQYPDEAKKEGIKSFICVPLKVRDKVIGSLRAYTSIPHKFNSAEIIFLNALANLGAIAIENSRLTDALQHRVEIFQELLNISKSITSSLDRKEVFSRILKSAVENLKAEGGILSILTSKGDKFEIVTSIGLSEEDITGGSIPLSKEIPNVLKGEVVSIFDASTDERIPYRKDIKSGVKSILVAPISVENKIIGVLKVYTMEHKTFTSDEIEFLKVLASLGGIAIENARLYKLALTNWQNLLKDVWDKFDVWGHAGEAY